eukprot:TRINITY_DN4489_c0_g1_i2.p2 TRINITY_DN4489_c0_g1~~TRINITY_DN4489_c0_g1_i2.p2  ORF type:complete len:108 (-),score=10.38 TRINITY_DN4489_c0_g1_i2:58-381(-)
MIIMCCMIVIFVLRSINYWMIFYVRYLATSLSMYISNLCTYSLEVFPLMLVMVLFAPRERVKGQESLPLLNDSTTEDKGKDDRFKSNSWNKTTQTSSTSGLISGDQL